VTLEHTKPPRLQGFREVGATGLEPVTPSLSSWFRGQPSRGQTGPEAPIHGGLRVVETERGAWFGGVGFRSFGPLLAHGLIA